jgi:hypothetical protein
MKKIVAMLGFFAVISTVAAVEPATKKVVFYKGFYNGNVYRQLPPGDQAVYVGAVIDGFLAAPLMGSDTTAAKQLNNCLGDMRPNAIQLAAIVNKWLEANPEHWGDPMNEATHTVLSTNCEARGFPIR